MGVKHSSMRRKHPCRSSSRLETLLSVASLRRRIALRFRSAGTVRFETYTGKNRHNMLHSPIGTLWMWPRFGDSNSSATCFGNLHPLQKRLLETSSKPCKSRITKSEPDSLFTSLTIFKKSPPCHSGPSAQQAVADWEKPLLDRAGSLPQSSSDSAEA